VKCGAAKLMDVMCRKVAEESSRTPIPANAGVAATVPQLNFPVVELYWRKLLAEVQFERPEPKVAEAEALPATSKFVETEALPVMKVEPFVGARVREVSEPMVVARTSAASKLPDRDALVPERSRPPKVSVLPLRFVVVLASSVIAFTSSSQSMELEAGRKFAGLMVTPPRVRLEIDAVPETSKRLETDAPPEKVFTAVQMFAIAREAGPLV